MSVDMTLGRTIEKCVTGLIFTKPRCVGRVPVREVRYSHGVVILELGQAENDPSGDLRVPRGLLKRMRLRPRSKVGVWVCSQKAHGFSVGQVPCELPVRAAIRPVHKTVSRRGRGLGKDYEWQMLWRNPKNLSTCPALGRFMRQGTR
jgi:hypothetical protein